MLEIRTAAAKVGIDLTGVKCTTGELQELSFPALVQVNGGHFAVVDRVTDLYVRVLDGLYDPIVVPRQDFEKKFSGFALVPSESLDTAGPKPARIWADSCIVDLGKIGANASLTHKFTIRTDARKPIAVNRIEACCGAELESASSMELSADRPLEVSFRFTGPGSGGALNKTVDVCFDQPKWPLLSLSAVGYASGDPMASPSFLDFGKIKRGSTEERELTIRHVRELRDRGVQSFYSSEYLTAGEFHYDPSSDTLSAAVKLTASADRGWIRDSITVRFGHAEDAFELTVPVCANVEAPVTVWPPQLMLGLVSPGTDRCARVKLTRTDGGKLSVLRHRSSVRYICHRFERRRWLDSGSSFGAECGVSHRGRLCHGENGRARRFGHQDSSLCGA